MFCEILEDDGAYEPSEELREFVTGMKIANARLDELDVYEVELKKLVSGLNSSSSLDVLRYDAATIFGLINGYIGLIDESIKYENTCGEVK